MRVRRNRPAFDPRRVPDSLLGPGRVMPTGAERVNALADYLAQHDALYYGEPRPGRIDALRLYVFEPGLTFEDFAARYTARSWKETR